MMLILMLATFSLVGAQCNDTLSSLNEVKAMLKTVLAKQTAQEGALITIQARQKAQEGVLIALQKELKDLKGSAQTQHTQTTLTLSGIKDCCSNVTAVSMLLTSAKPTTSLVTSTLPITTPIRHITDCSVHADSGSVKNGIYSINVLGLMETKAWCNNGFTVMQRRKFDDMKFDKTIAEYAEGFGRPEADHWLGLKFQHALTRDRSCQLSIQIVVDSKAPANLKNCQSYGWHDCSGDVRETVGNEFRVSSAVDGFRIRIKYSRTELIHPQAKSHFTLQFNGLQFSTKDHDKDTWDSGNCATYLAAVPGGFWADNCYPGLLNTKSLADKCAKTNKICGRFYPYFFESSLIQFKCD